MKTIKDAAKECEFHSIGNQSHFTPEQIFRYGVEFAQKWIKVEEELPKHRDVVLAKVPLINYPLLFAYNEIESKWYQFDEGDFFESEINPTCWRPIERI